MSSRSSQRPAFWHGPLAKVVPYGPLIAGRRIAQFCLTTIGAPALSLLDSDRPLPLCVRCPLGTYEPPSGTWSELQASVPVRIGPG